MNQIFKYKDNAEFLEAMRSEIEASQQNHFKRQLSARQLIKPYLRVAQCKRLILSKDDYRILYPDFDTQTYASNDEYLLKAIAEICNYYNFDTNLKFSDVPSILASDFAVSSLVERLTLPKTGLLEVQNSQIYDVFSKSFVKRDPSNYYYVKYDIDPFSKPNHNSCYYQAAELLYNSWGQNDPHKIRMLKLLTYLAILGYGAESWFILLGESGRGKSTFIDLLTNLASEDLCTSMNMHEILSHDNLSSIRVFDKVIFGHELPADHKFSSKEMSALKSLVTGNIVRAHRKYLSSTPICNRGLKIQATNHLPHLYVGREQRLNENINEVLDTSLSDRFMIIPFGLSNHRHDTTNHDKIEKLTNLTVRQLITHQNFLNELVLMILNEFAFANEKEIRAEVNCYKSKFNQELIKSLVSSSETVEEFFKQCYKDGLFDQSKVPIAALYYKYCKDRQIGNRSAKVVSPRSFTQTVQMLVKDYDLKSSDTRSLVSTHDMSRCNLRELFYGHSLDSFLPLSEEERVLGQKCYSIVNDNPTAFFYQYLKNHSENELVQVMNELAVRENMKIERIYAMSQRDIEELYNHHKDDL
jgi:hypothetical protein